MQLSSTCDFLTRQLLVIILIYILFPILQVSIGSPTNVIVKFQSNLALEEDLILSYLVKYGWYPLFALLRMIIN